jgi:3-hydroxyisobutyrate dehydrogenase
MASNEKERHRRVTVLGTGRIGSALARRWAASGWDVIAWNRTQLRAQELVEHGVSVMPDLRTAVDGAETVVSVVSDGPALISILIDAGALNRMEHGALLIDLSTIDVDSSRRVATTAAEVGVQFVRGALSGSPALVETGRASALLSGEPRATAAAQELLSTVVAGTTVLGQADESKVVKLAINALVGAAVLVLAEAMVTIDANGVTREAFVAALEKSAIWSPLMGYKSVAIRDHDFRITATTADLMKDVSLAVDLQKKVGVSATVTAAVLNALKNALSRGYEDDDCIAVVSSLQAESGQPLDLFPT